MYARAQCNDNVTDVGKLWGRKAHSIFRATMSSKRFRFLSASIPFDEKTKRIERYRTDKFASFRDVFEMFIDNCLKPLKVGDYLLLALSFTYVFPYLCFPYLRFPYLHCPYLHFHYL